MIGIDFDAIRERVPLRAFLESLGCMLFEEEDTYRLACPIHNEQHGHSMILYPGGRWFCHGKCVSQYPRGGDVIDLAGAMWGLSEQRLIAERLLGEAPKTTILHPPRQAGRPPPASKWPARNLEKIDAIVRGELGLYDIWERSPRRFDDDRNHAEEIADIIFPGDPLLCCGLTERAFATRRRSDWRRQLAELALIVPNPMLRPAGFTHDGRLSEHTLDATAARVYLVVECDFARYHNDGKPTAFLPLVDAWDRDGITTFDACCAVLWHLKERLPLVLGVHSGGKGVHGWYLAFDRDEDTELFPFMQHAHVLGADPVTWCRSQFVRLPDGRRQNGSPQITFYLNPQNAVTLCTHPTSENPSLTAQPNNPRHKTTNLLPALKSSQKSMNRLTTV